MTTQCDICTAISFAMVHLYLQEVNIKVNEIAKKLILSVRLNELYPREFCELNQMQEIIQPRRTSSCADIIRKTETFCVQFGEYLLPFTSLSSVFRSAV
jgi:hypothetical protein